MELGFYMLRHMDMKHSETLENQDSILENMCLGASQAITQPWNSQWPMGDWGTAIDKHSAVQQDSTQLQGTCTGA